MKDKETADELRAYVRSHTQRKRGPFSWPTDGCGYEQHMRFVAWRNKHWPSASAKMGFGAFVLDYAQRLERGEIPPFEGE